MPFSNEIDSIAALRGARQWPGSGDGSAKAVLTVDDCDVVAVGDRKGKLACLAQRQLGGGLDGVVGGVADECAQIEIVDEAQSTPVHEECRAYARAQALAALLRKQHVEHVYPGTGGFLQSLEEELPQVIAAGAESHKIRGCVTYAGNTLEELADNMGLAAEVKENFLATMGKIVGETVAAL